MTLTGSLAPETSIFTVTLTGGDDLGNELSRTLTFDLRKGTPPVEDYVLEVTGSGIDERMTVRASESPTVSVDIVASEGIKDFVVNMESSNSEFNGALTAMSPLGLLDESKYDNLAQLGLPYGDAVKDKTELTFDISNFVPMMAIFLQDAPEGFTADFHLTITDNADHVVEETIKLQIEQ